MEQNFPLSASSPSSPSPSSQPPKLSDVSAVPSMTPQTASFSSFALRNQQFNVQQPLFAAPSPYSLPSTALSSLASSSSASPSYSSSSLGSKTQKKISCAYDIDCRPGEMCIKPDGACWNSSIEGVCGYAPDVCEDDVTLGEKEMKALMKGKLVIEGEEEVMAEKEAMEREKEKASEKERRERRAREEREKREEKEERQRRRDTGEGDADAVVLNTNPTGQTFCGCDGADYTSRCQALKNRVNVDFVGKCADKIPSQLKDEHTNSRDVTDFRRFGYRDTSRPTRSSARDASSFFPTQPSASLYSSPSSYSSSRSPSSPSPSPSSSSYLSSSPYSSPSPTKDTNGYYLKPNSHSSYQTPRYKSPSYSSPSSSYRPSHSSSRSRSDERGEPAVFSETPPSSVYKPSPRIVGKKSAK
ncbi:uncharacterized protein MONOS_14884 [Monocercomonoides exilis]|uniref:uncharacterized protein n=1 Tax=Monocercomonoides exilis TaxID=2049356 RepID=UPI003559AB92|nr:hypothetical protein MONOS_14884 [Monocercomonoides exilis]